MRSDYRTGGGASDRARAAMIRDAALARVSRTRRWVWAGAAALTAAFAALVSAIAPGRTLAAKSPSASESASAAGATSSTGSGRTNGSASTNGSTLPRMPAPAGASDLGLQGPDQAPSSSSGGGSSSSSSGGGSSQSQSAPAQSDPSQSAPAPAPAPAPATAPPVVSGGS